MNMLLNWGQRCAQGKARSKSAAVRFWGRHDYWEQVTFRVHYKVILFNLFGSHLKLWLLPLKRLHTFFPSMCRPAPRRLKWFTAGHITTVIRDRRIYNFLSLNTSLRIAFFYDCAVRTVFHGFGSLLLSLQAVLSLSAVPVTRRLQRYQPGLRGDVRASSESECRRGSGLWCFSALHKGTEGNRRASRGGKWSKAGVVSPFAAEWRVRETKTTLGGLRKHKQACESCTLHTLIHCSCQKANNESNITHTHSLTPW